MASTRCAPQTRSDTGAARAHPELADEAAALRLELPAAWAALATWAGLGAIVLAVVTFGASTEYPGAIVAISVIGAALVIGGGVVEPGLGAERLIGTSLFRGPGKISYALYLWHWPILIVAAERTGKTTLPLGESLLLVAVAVAISVATYFIIENPSGTRS